jgi:hypothetical protein
MNGITISTPKMTAPSTSAGDKSKSRRTASLALLGLVSHAATSKD